MPSQAWTTWTNQLKANAGYGPNPGEDVTNGMDGLQGWYPGKGYSNILGDVRDYFTDWRGDLIAQEQNDLAKQTLEHQMNMDLHGTEIRAEDYARAGLSKYALAGGGAGGQGSSAQGPRLQKPGRAAAMRESMGMMMQFGQIMAGISRTKAETDAINAQIPGHQANSQLAAATLEDRIRAVNLDTTRKQYETIMAQYDVTAAQAESMARYYRGHIEAAWHRYGGQPGEFSVQEWSDRNRDMFDYGRFGGTRDLQFNLEWLDPGKMNNPEYRQATAEAIAIAQAQHDFEITKNLGVRSNTSGWETMLVEAFSSMLEGFGIGRKK